MSTESEYIEYAEPAASSYRIKVDANYPPPQLDADAPVYVISVAAELAGMHPQTLRQYDRLGLVSPGRSAGRSRRYSLRDVAMLREVQRLSQDEGVNLAGIKRIIELEAEVDRLRQHVAYLIDELAAAARAPAEPDMTAYHRRYLPVPAPPTRGALVVWRAPRR
jgi:MerR family transcriptional regulator/heat shock protein HspR